MSPRPFTIFLTAIVLQASAAAVTHKSRSCSSTFKNVVFNSGVNNEPNFPGRFQTIQSTGGVADWIGFTLNDPSPATPDLVDNQIRMVVTGSDVSAGKNLVTGSNPPQYLQLLNEPDGGFYGQPVYSPSDAVQVLQPILQSTTNTTFLSPAPAYPNSDWLPQFFAACNCEARFPIILAHIYAVNPQDAISSIKTVMGQFPNKRIWITEIAPASSPSQNCTLAPQDVINWMNTVLGFASQQPQIDRVFWNSGEYGTLYPDNPTQCNPSLTNQDGSATALLHNYASIC